MVFEFWAMLYGMVRFFVFTVSYGLVFGIKVDETTVGSSKVTCYIGEKFWSNNEIVIHELSA